MRPEGDSSDSAAILIVDDQEPNRRLLSELVTMLGHTPLTADTGLAGLEEMRTNAVDLVLLDMMMPLMNGFEVLEKMGEDEQLRHIPVIVISGLDETESMAKCIKAGADDYLTKPFNPMILRARINACLERKRLHDLEDKYKHDVVNYSKELEQRVREQVAELSSAQLATIFALSKLAESRDPETGEHLERMREYCKSIAQLITKFPKYSSRLGAEFVDNVYAAAPLHDIGKVGVPDRILLKPGKLDEEEFETMKKHSLLGADTLRAVYKQHLRNEFIKLGIEIAESHHEKWDGTGYPHGLKGDDIPLSGRILGIADVYDALTSKRVYKDAFSHEKSRSIILEGRGTHFDPEIVDVFLEVEEIFIETRKTFRDTKKDLII